MQNEIRNTVILSIRLFVRPFVRLSPKTKQFNQSYGIYRRPIGSLTAWLFKEPIPGPLR